MTAKDGWRETLRASVMENLGLKVLSLVCALGFYAFIHGAENAVRPVAVSVVAVMPPPSANRQLMTQLPTEVAVTVRGSRAQLDDLRGEDLGSLQLDLQTGRESHIDIDPSMIHVPPGLVVEQVRPRSIEVKWDDVVSRQIPIQIARTGDPAGGFVVKSTRAVEPRFVTARGPRSVVDVIQYARAVPFDVSGLAEGTHKRPLALEKPAELVAYDVESVTAAVDIAREQQKRVFDHVKVEVIGTTRAKAQPSTVQVEVEGTPEQVGALLPEGIIPRVEPKAAGIDVSQPGSAYIDVLVDVPPAAGDTQPATVRVNPPKVLVKW